MIYVWYNSTKIEHLQQWLPFPEKWKKQGIVTTDTILADRPVGFSLCMDQSPIKGQIDVAADLCQYSNANGLTR